MARNYIAMEAALSQWSVVANQRFAPICLKLRTRGSGKPLNSLALTGIFEYVTPNEINDLGGVFPPVHTGPLLGCFPNVPVDELTSCNVNANLIRIPPLNPSAGPILTHRRAMNDAIGSRDQPLRNRDAQGFGSFQVDDQFKFFCILHGNVRWIGTLQDLINE